MLIHLFSSSLTYNTHCVCSVTSAVSDSATPETVARQALLPTGISRQEHWSGLLLYPPNDYIYQMRVYTEGLSHSPADGHLIVSTFFFMLFGECVSLGQIPRSGIAGSRRLRVLCFGRFHQTAFPSGWTRLRPSSKCLRDSRPQPLCQQLVLSASMGVQGCVVASLKPNT